MPIQEIIDSFKQFTHTYKVVEGHPILVDVVVPKSLLEKGPHSEAWKTKRPIEIGRAHV